MRTLAFLVCLSPLAAVSAQPTFTSELTADQQTYAYGETITLTYAITNGSSDVVELYGSGTEGCGAGLTLGTFRLPLICTLDEAVYIFDPGESNAWIWTLVPSEIGAPEADAPLAEAELLLSPRSGPPPAPPASVQVMAPQYLGGPVVVGYAAADQGAVDALRESLGGEVTRPAQTVDGTTTQVWQITGTALLDALATLNADANVRYAERSVDVVDVIYTPTDAAPTATMTRPPAPNPTLSVATFTVRPERPGPVLVDLVDALGRRVAVLHDGPLAAERTFTVATAGLPAGVYTVRVRAEGTQQTHRLTVVR